MRDIYLILGMGAVAVVIGGVLFLFGPSSLHSDIQGAFVPGSSSTSVQVPFTVLKEGINTVAITKETNYRITSEQDLKTLWTLVYGMSGPQVPTVDFSKYEVLALFDGSHQTTGFSISIDKVLDQDSVRTVYIKHTNPAAGCKAQDTPTSPFVVIQVPKTQFNLSHVTVTATSTCSS